MAEQSEQWGMTDDLSWYQLFSETAEVSFNALQEGQGDPDIILQNSFESVAKRIKHDAEGFLRVEGALDHVPPSLVDAMRNFKLGVQFGQHMLKHRDFHLFVPRALN